MFEVTKSVIRTRKSKKDITYNGEKKEQTMIYKTLSRKHKIEQDEPQYGEGTAYRLGTPKFTSVFYWGSSCSILCFLLSVL
jgi:hypothetical protein